MTTNSYLKYNKHANEKNALIYIHGFLGNKHTWKSTMENMDIPYLQIAIDLPFHGQGMTLPKKQWEQNNSFSLFSKQVASSIQTILKTENIQQYALLGYSLGGRTAMHMTVENYLEPEFLIIESSGAGHADPSRFQWDKELQEKLTLTPQEQFLEQWYNAGIFQNIKLCDNYHTAVQSMLKNDFPNIAQGMPYFAQSIMPVFEEKLTKINTPTLLIHGKLDDKYSKMMKHLATIIPNNQLISVEHASHNTHLMNPKQFSQTVCDFIETRKH